ncbi:ankyrin repeat domain-containing protein [Halobacteriovorax marinus]|uniref:ankyrin repeat domain-containing protein n=1 Tax=Halobacteriovorax marinus TaxID=97084 RepID=UPI003A90322A
MNIKHFKIIFIVATLWLVVVTIKFTFFPKTEHNHQHHSHENPHHAPHTHEEQVDQVVQEVSESTSFESLPFSFQVDQLIQRGDFENFKRILSAKENVKETIDAISSEDGRTLLTRASFGAPLPYIKYLVDEMGADVNKADKEEITPLMEAAASENIEVLSYLLERGAKTGAKNKLGADALTIALSSGDAAMARLLLKNGADPNHKWNKHGVTHLMNAARNGHLDALKVLLSFKANINTQDLEGNTALHYAASEGFKSIVSELLRENATKTIKNQQGNSPLELARENNFKEIEDLLK